MKCNKLFDQSVINLLIDYFEVRIGRQIYPMIPIWQIVSSFLFEFKSVYLKLKSATIGIQNTLNECIVFTNEHIRAF